MEPKPFFSIVLPTKNRPELLREAIQSVLWQDSEDYELIVSDNWNDERTKRAIDEFVGDRRVRYVRPDRELNMPDHWEFASTKATGEYVFILTDRTVFRNGALKKIEEAIRTYAPKGVEAYAWSHDIFDIKTRAVRPVGIASRGVAISKTDHLLIEYAKTERVSPRFPLLPNACYHRDLAGRIRKKHGRLFFPIAPDNTSDFLFLSYTDAVASIGEPLMLSQNAENSNGAMTLQKGPEGYFRTLNMPTWYRHVPIKVPSVQSLNFDDFLTMRAMVGVRPVDADVDWVNYFLHCYEEIVYFGRNGYIRNRKKEFMDAWNAALADFDEKVQNEVKAKMFRIKILFSVKAHLASSFLTPWLRNVQSSIQYRSARRKYEDVLTAAGFTSS